MHEQNAELQVELRMLFLSNQEMRRQLLKDDQGLKELRMLRIRIKELELHAGRAKRPSEVDRSIDTKQKLDYTKAQYKTS
jgi:hypothetical protein